MKRYVILFLINLMLALLQLSFFGELFGALYSPNLILILGFVFMFLDLSNLAFYTVFIGGLLLDLLGFHIVGVSSLIFILILTVYLALRKITRARIVNIVYLFLALGVYEKILGNVSSYFSIEVYISSIISVFIALPMYISIKNITSYLKRSGYKLS